MFLFNLRRLLLPASVQRAKFAGLRRSAPRWPPHAPPKRPHQKPGQTVMRKTIAAASG